MDQPQTLLPKRSHDFLKSVPPSTLSSSTTPNISNEKSNSTFLLNKKSSVPVPANRQQSLFRGTASSRAKAVRSPTNNNKLDQQRRLSSKTRKQSLSNMAVDPNQFIVNNQGRRSSWSPLVQQHQQDGASGRKTPIPPVPVDAPVYQQELQQQKEQQKQKEQQQVTTTTNLIKKAAEVATAAANTITTTNAYSSPSSSNTAEQKDSGSIINAPTASHSLNNSSSDNKSSSGSATASASASSTNSSINTTVVAQEIISKQQQKQLAITTNNSKDKSAAAATTTKQEQETIIPLETPPPDDDQQEAKLVAAGDDDDEFINKQQQDLSKNSSFNQDDEVSNIRLDHCGDNGSDGVPDPQHHHHLHHHNHNHPLLEDADDNGLPNYMRRPICAACNRNVKVTSSSESLLSLLRQQHCTTTTTSRRSSVSASAPTNHASVKFNNNKRRSSSTNTSGSLSKEIKITTSSTTTNKSSNSSSSNNEETATTRSHSPTSPIPTTRRLVVSGSSSVLKRRKSNLKEISSQEVQVAEKDHQPQQQQQQPEQEESSIISSKKNDVKDKWNELISQQKKLLEFINRDNNPNTIMMTFLPPSQQTTGNNAGGEKDETSILETQLELLKLFESFLLLNHLNASSQQFVPTTSGATEEEEGQLTLTTINSNSIEGGEEPAKKLEIPSWQTKFEYSMTHMKWTMSEWFFGSIVGSGSIQEIDFDAFGYTNNVVISGVCVTTEPGLLPKNLQKYYKQDNKKNKEMVCHKYIIHTKNRETRLHKFVLLDTKDWVQDETVDQCEFSIKEQVDGTLVRTRHCSIEFGALHRRHHCRYCGHIFCQAHSSNTLPLFLPNGEERGEWSRVCDTCFYQRIEPQFISRS